MPKATKPKVEPVPIRLRRNDLVEGGIVEKEAPIQVSKVLLICPQCATATRFRMTVTAEGKKSRACRKCKDLIDG
jgi:large subunit ribosomal protein L24